MNAAWWWIDRWRKSTAYTDMTAEEQGLYRNLLDEVWLREDHIIPDDPRILARVSGDHEAWKKHGKKVLKWMEKVDGGWTNNTAMEVINQSQRRAETQKRYRLKKNNKGDNTGDNNPDSPSPSPSPSPSKVSVSKKKVPKKTLEERTKILREDVYRYADKYTTSMLEKFIRNWGEADTKGKMKWEKQDTWSTGGRLATWCENQMSWHNEECLLVNIKPVPPPSEGVRV